MSVGFLMCLCIYLSMTFYTIKKRKNLMHELEQKIQSNEETGFSSHLADPNYGAERTNSLLFLKNDFGTC